MVSACFRAQGMKVEFVGQGVGFGFGQDQRPADSCHMGLCSCPGAPPDFFKAMRPTSETYKH